MTLIPFRGVGSRGLNFDLRANQLTQEEWSDAKNVRFDNNRIIKANNFQYVNLATVQVEPYFLRQYRTPTAAFWLFAGLTDVYGFADTEAPGTPTKLTRVASDYTTVFGDRWQGDMFNGVGILNNGRDVPQVWSPVELATPLIDLPNWPASYSARVVRPYLNFLVALDITKSSGTRYPIMVKWSSPADPGTVPTSWDETTPSTQAGEQILADGPYTLIDATPFGQSLLLYTEQTTWAMTFIGGDYIFSFNKLFAQSGLLAQGCAVAFKNMQFVVTRDDIIIHDGHQIQSIADKRVRKFFFDNISAVSFDRAANYTPDQDNALLMHVAPHYTRQEMWILYPLAGESTIRQALVWNWRYNTWTFMDVPACHYASGELPVPTRSADTWDEDTSTTWNGETTQIWDDPSFLRFREKFRVAKATATYKILEYDRDAFTDADSAAYRSYVERRGLTAIGLNRDGSIAEDRAAFKFLKGVWLTINGETDAVLDLYVGSYDAPDSTPTWQGPFSYTVGTTEYIDINPVTARFFALRVEETATAYWELTEYQLDIVPISER